MDTGTIQATDFMFTAQDLQLINHKGLTVKDIESQLQSFSSGFPPLDITGPAVPGNGIVCLDREEQDVLVRRYEQWNGSRIKFVPASGAASRMFKDLFEARELLSRDRHARLPEHMEEFYDRLQEFAFYPTLSGLDGFDLQDRYGILDLLLERNGLNYAFLPKGLIPFHKYPAAARTPFEEHLVEAALSSAQPDGTVRVHFTVSEEHRPLFAELWHKVGKIYEEKFGVRFLISFSTQSPATDTLAVGMDNRPFRRNDGSLVFRPGGHGALLGNLNSLEEDMVIIRNIDNVVPESLLEPVIHWRKVMAGYLLQCRKQVYAYINELKQGAGTLRLKEMAVFLERTFGFIHPRMEGEEFRSYLFCRLNRPIRICGMVPATGEPGGGPFRVRDKNGSESLQILESVQLQGKKYESTHFNPVDIVCSFKAYDGTAYKLTDFRDDNTGLITYKSLEGRDLKALELPGLWNGGMSRWNTAFVEVPISTFNPVKTVMDLLRKEHNN
ncbi:MAG: DUF4301 family protein [Bacteroidales bacterium]|jgi:hypothetical protein|nr:DUF4301 family protein [Bacteroidales bacterium]MDD5047086.1 DUF4301 family protein [Bacteroidales bacterium]